MVGARQRRRDPERRMPLLDHARELRNRVGLALLGVAIAAIGGWFLFDAAFAALQYPVERAVEMSGADVSINFSGVLTAIDMRVRVSIFLGAILASPWWLYQLWAFIAPGLKSREKWHIAGFLGSAIPLFGLGVWGGWLVLPQAIPLLTDFVPEGASNLIDAQVYLSFVMNIMIAFGLTMVVPVVMVALMWLRVVSPRQWLHAWRWAVVVVLIIAALVTPTPDVVSMFVVAVPMGALYFLAIAVGSLAERRPRKART